MWYTLSKRLDDAIKELEKSSDRAIGIIAGAMVDSQLYEALSHFLHGDDEAYSTKVRKDMFGSDGPLGSFGARTNLAYLLGLITEDAHADLQTFGKIRNSFAHYTEHDTFETESIKARCSNFKLIKKYVTTVTKPELTASGQCQLQDSISISADKVITLNLVDAEAVLSTPKGRFIATTKLFCAVFSEFADEKVDWEKYPLL